ncbi:MAG: ferredoxin [archaeon]
MSKCKIVFDREACIGALACNAIAPKSYLLADDGKVDFSGAVFNEQTKKWELIVEGDAVQINKEAAEACPVHAIEVIELKE